MTTDIPERFYEQARSIRNGVIWESNAATRVLAEALYGAWKEGAAEAGAENERLRKALERLLASPALADENHSDPEWGCEETAIAVTAARRALEGGE